MLKSEFLIIFNVTKWTSFNFFPQSLKYKKQTNKQTHSWFMSCKKQTLGRIWPIIQFANPCSKLNQSSTSNCSNILVIRTSLYFFLLNDLLSSFSLLSPHLLLLITTYFHLHKTSYADKLIKIKKKIGQWLFSPPVGIKVNSLWYWQCMMAQAAGLVLEIRFSPRLTNNRIKLKHQLSLLSIR